MRRLFIIACACLLACACFADQNPYTRTITGLTTTNSFILTTINNLRGYCDEISVSVGGGVVTGNVVVAYTPLDTNFAIVNVATATVIATKQWRRRFNVDSVNGIQMTNGTPDRLMFSGESLRMSVSNSPSNKVWTTTIKLDQPGR